MRFTPVKFLTTLAITLFIGFIVVAGLRAVGLVGKPGPAAANDPEGLLQEATDALVAVSQRTPGERRPASFDSVLAPLDKVLKITNDLVNGDNFDPVRDYERVRSLTMPVINIAEKADAQARNETGFMIKEYRFNSQKAEACQYLAATLWERINHLLPESTGFFDEGPTYPANDMRELRRILDAGIEADPENADLLYNRGVVNRAEGLFVPAVRDLEHAVGINQDMASAWNVLGLVRINLKEFDKAEDALERARAAALKQAQNFNQDDPGPEYTAILYNLASFHENLAAFYNRENRITPTVEYQRLTVEHSDNARRYYQEFLTRDPPTSPDAQSVRTKLQSLP